MSLPSYSSLQQLPRKPLGCTGAAVGPSAVTAWFYARLWAEVEPSNLRGNWEAEFHSWQALWARCSWRFSEIGSPRHSETQQVVTSKKVF